MTSLETQIETQMVGIEGGAFNMGSDKYEAGQPIHKVEVPSFYLACYPVTNAQFVAFLNEKGNQEEEGRTWVDLTGSYSGVRCGVRENQGAFECIPGLEHHPMIYVNWHGASAYCRWLSHETGQAYRLPSESEWEYAARGREHQNGFSYAGSNYLNEVGWYYGNSHDQTKPVGLKFSNALGLYDMSGNVREWCADHWHENYEGAPQDGSAWMDGSGESRRVVRGGSWGSSVFNCRVSNRLRLNALVRDYFIGFRVARY